MTKRGVQRWTAVVVGIGALVTIVATLVGFDFYRHQWAHDGWSRPVFVVHLFSVTAAIIGGLTMVWRRPANRCGYVAIALGIVLGSWYVAFFAQPERGWWLYAQPALAWVLRPLLFWLVLAYPIGRLDRGSRRFWWSYVVLAVIVFGCFAATSADDDAWPLQVFGPSRWNPIVQSTFWDVGGFVASVAVLAIVQRRVLRFRGTIASRIAKPALWAAIVAAGADLLLVMTGPLREIQSDSDGLTPFGTAVQMVDLARFGVVVLILAVSARRAWPASDSFDADLPPASIRDVVVQALGDPTADVALVDETGRWVDTTGAPRVAPRSGSTLVSRDGAVVAAVEHDDAFAAHPALIEATIAAAELQLDAGRQTAMAEEHEHELRHVAREVLEAEDTARGRLERDLHDGAQQALVGVTLHAALAARSPAPGAAIELADAVDDARTTLLRIASGRPPALLAERGLDGALGALVLTAGLPVTVDVDRCDDLGDTLQRAIWFSASEAVTNALKHAQASQLELSLRRRNGEVALTVRDDGRGGVTHAPVALAARVAEAGGTLAIESTNRGTRVRVQFPVGSS